MRKITKEATEAFLAGKDYYNSNTKVKVGQETISMFLHGNLIATHTKDTPFYHFTLAGWNTPTTRERLNGILSEIALFKFCQKDFKPCIYDGQDYTELEHSNAVISFSTQTMAYIIYNNERL